MCDKGFDCEIITDYGPDYEDNLRHYEAYMSEQVPQFSDEVRNADIEDLIAQDYGSNIELHRPRVGESTFARILVALALQAQDAQPTEVDIA